MLKSEGFIILASVLFLFLIFLVFQTLEIKKEYEKIEKSSYSKYFDEIKKNFIRELSYVSDISSSEQDILNFLNYSLSNFNFFNSVFLSIFVDSNINISIYNYANFDIKDLKINCTNSFYISKVSTLENYNLSDNKCNTLNITFSFLDSYVSDQIEIRSKGVYVFYLIFLNDEISINKIVKYYD
ncbi:MAG: hypothetical protein QW409_03225 [Candidatus Aenigmatarchaeota archaeon]